MSKRTVIAAFVGGAVLGTASLFFAPKKGSELREDAQTVFAQVKEKAQTALETYRNRENNQEMTSDLLGLGTVISEKTEEIQEETAADNPAK